MNSAKVIAMFGLDHFFDGGSCSTLCELPDRANVYRWGEAPVICNHITINGFQARKESGTLYLTTSRD